MSNEERCFGKSEGLGKRCAYWARQLSMDKRYPWVGMGLIDDLKCVAREHGIDPDETFPDMRKSPPPVAGPVEGPISTHGQPEYDL